MLEPRVCLGCLGVRGAGVSTARFTQLFALLCACSLVPLPQGGRAEERSEEDEGAPPVITCWVLLVFCPHESRLPHTDVAGGGGWRLVVPESFAPVASSGPHLDLWGCESKSPVL